MSQTERYPRLQQERPKRKNRSRKILLLVLFFFIVILAVLFFKSSISRINEIHINGVRYLSNDQVGQASGVQIGDQFLFTRTSAVARRIAEIPLVKVVKVRKNFPGELTIDITEYPEVAVELTAQGRYAIVLENGMTVQPKNDSLLLDKPVLSGWKQDDSVKRRICRLLGGIPKGKLADISEIQPDFSASYPDKIKIYTRSHFEVTTTVSYLQKKLDIMSAIISHEQPGKVILLEADTYEPFNNAAAQPGDNPASPEPSPH